MNRTMRAAATIEQRMLDDIDAAYHDILAPVLRKHRKNLAQLEKLMQTRKDKGHGDFAYPRTISLRGKK